MPPPQQYGQQQMPQQQYGQQQQMPNQQYGQQQQQQMPPQQQQQRPLGQTAGPSGASTEPYAVHALNITRSTSNGKLTNNNSIPRLGPEVRNTAASELLTTQGTPPHVRPAACGSVRPTHRVIASTPAAMDQLQVPFGCLVRPLGEEPIPLVDFATIGPDVTVVRCRKCRGYINPYVHWSDGGRRWMCPMCRMMNDCPAGYYCPTDNYGQRVDVTSRPELCHASCEFVAPTEYMVRPPQRPIFTFLLDVGYNAVQSGMLKAQCDGILAALPKLANDDSIYVSFIAFDSTIYLFNLRSTLAAPRMIVAPDLVYDVVAVNENSVLDPVEFPALSEDLIVPLKDSIGLVEQLMQRLPEMFANTKTVDSCFGPALTAAISLMTPTGGKIVASVAALPTLGEGRLASRADGKLTNQPKEYTLCVPSNEWYKHRSLAASQAQISIDLAVNGDSSVELATIAPVSRYTSGHIYRYTQQSAIGFTRQMERILIRDTAFEAVIRIRSSSSITAPNFFGHCYVRGPDLLALPVCDSDTAYAVHLQISSPIQNNAAYVQFALLYTTRTRERRIRVHTIHLPVSPNPSRVLNNVDCLGVAAMMSKMGVDFAVNNPFAVAQQKLTDRVVAMLKNFKKVAATPQKFSNQLLVPDALRNLPFFLTGIFRSAALRTISNIETPPDERVANMSLAMTAPVESMLAHWCNWMYAIYAPKEAVERLPLTVFSSFDQLRNDSIFVVEAGMYVYVFLGKNVPPKVFDEFGLPQRELNNNSVTSPATEPPACALSDEELAALKERYDRLIASSQNVAFVGQWAPLVFGKHGQTPRSLGCAFIEDDCKEAVSYLNYLNALYKKVVVE